MLGIHLLGGRGGSIFTIKMPKALNREDTDKCTLTLT